MIFAYWEECLRTFEYRGRLESVPHTIRTAETVLLAMECGSFDAITLSHYHDLLGKSIIMKDLKSFQNVTPFLSSHPHFFTMYPELASAAVKELLTVDSLSKADKLHLIIKLVRSQRPARKLMKDLYDSWRTFS